MSSKEKNMKTSCINNHCWSTTEEGKTWQDCERALERIFLLSALTSTIIDNNDTWFIDSDASKHMIGYKYSHNELREKNSTLYVELGDNNKYAVKGVGTSSF